MTPKAAEKEKDPLDELEGLTGDDEVTPASQPVEPEETTKPEEDDDDDKTSFTEPTPDDKETVKAEPTETPVTLTEAVAQITSEAVNISVVIDELEQALAPVLTGESQGFPTPGPGAFDDLAPLVGSTLAGRHEMALARARLGELLARLAL